MPTCSADREVWARPPVPVSLQKPSTASIRRLMERPAMPANHAKHSMNSAPTTFTNWMPPPTTRWMTFVHSSIRCVFRLPSGNTRCSLSTRYTCSHRQLSMLSSRRWRNRPITLCLSWPRPRSIKYCRPSCRVVRSTIFPASPLPT